ncbi:hypothetical protein PENDEC_c008G06102 [Penicillium decumbens]|uniref:Yeast cell wall synthesis Kre9/Knh1-like N-terminal domain-containing protein n=1 Tax=Penicillium decumbens TaxID=69771 RepID=A0A1V6PEN6_PENDC|nr:hypothetical protein PENDEC_c008G06102 [Penicillium decumbens]
MRFTTAAVFSTLAAFAAAYTQPDYSKSPSGNAIVSPGVNEQVPEGAPYTIKWEPTAGKKVSLVLLRGPSSNVKPLQTIAEEIPNSGSYKWTPSTSLDVDNTHYGILLVVEGTGQYQYSTQFGIAGPAGGSGSDASSTVVVTDDITTTYCPETASESATLKPVTTPSSTVVISDDITTTYCPEEASSASAQASSTPATVSAASSSTVWATLESTTTYCPEEASSSASVKPVSTPVTTPATVSAAPSSSSTKVITDSITTTYCPEEASSASLSATGRVSPVSTPVRPTTLASSASSSGAPSGTASATPSSSPVFNGAGRSAISLGAIAAGVFAVLAL